MSEREDPTVIDTDKRPGEVAADLPGAGDALLYYIGVIRTPWTSRKDCPKRGNVEGPVCRIEIDRRWAGALEGIDAPAALEVLYWMHLSRRDLTQQRPRGAARLIGTFALRSPVRPNPIACSRVHLEGRIGTTLLVRGLDCIDGTPLIDVKPDRCPVGAPPSGRDGD